MTSRQRARKPNAVGIPRQFEAIMQQLPAASPTL